MDSELRNLEVFLSSSFDTYAARDFDRLVFRLRGYDSFLSKWKKQKENKIII